MFKKKNSNIFVKYYTVPYITAKKILYIYILDFKDALMFEDISDTNGKHLDERRKGQKYRELL